MTIANLRDKYPYKDFMFYKGKYQYQGTPFYHAIIKGYKVKGDTVNIFM